MGAPMMPRPMNPSFAMRCFSPGGRDRRPVYPPGVSPLVLLNPEELQEGSPSFDTWWLLPDGYGWGICSGAGLEYLSPYFYCSELSKTRVTLVGMR